jgi:hypothetical protein
MVQIEKSVSDKTEVIERNVEQVVEQVADDLDIKLPSEKQFPFGIRLVILLTLLGGVAIVGNIFADSYSFQPISISFYIFRLIMGLLLVLIAYGLHQRRLFAIWILGFTTIISFISNPFLAILPIATLIYLYTKRKLLKQTKEIKIGKTILKF